jgi:hypothetical protein
MFASRLYRSPGGRRRSGLPAGRTRPRKGAIQTVELLLVLPILLGLLFAIIEFGLLLSANQRLKMASQLACRVGTLPADDPVEREQAIRRAAKGALGKPHLIRAHRLEFDAGRYTGDPVVVEIRLPMKAAAPDLLAVLGLGLKDRELLARTVMRKE